MLVLPPLESVTRAQVAKAALAVALTPVVLSLFRVVRRKMRITKGLKPIPGPKGSLLLGIFPEIVANLARLYEYQVRHWYQPALVSRWPRTILLFWYLSINC